MALGSVQAALSSVDAISSMDIDGPVSTFSGLSHAVTSALRLRFWLERDYVGLRVDDSPPEGFPGGGSEVADDIPWGHFR